MFVKVELSDNIVSTIRQIRLDFYKPEIKQHFCISCGEVQVIWYIFLKYIQLEIKYFKYIPKTKKNFAICCFFRYQFIDILWEKFGDVS